MRDAETSAPSISWCSLSRHLSSGALSRTLISSFVHLFCLSSHFELIYPWVCAIGLPVCMEILFVLSVIHTIPFVVDFLLFRYFLRIAGRLGQVRSIFFPKVTCTDKLFSIKIKNYWYCRLPTSRNQVFLCSRSGYVVFYGHLDLILFCFKSPTFGVSRFSQRIHF